MGAGVIGTSAGSIESLLLSDNESSQMLSKLLLVNLPARSLVPNIWFAKLTKRSYVRLQA